MLDIQKDIQITRSPAKVCWHVKLGSVLLGTRDTKAEADTLKENLVRMTRQ